MNVLAILASLISISVTPAYCFEPCTLTVTLRVVPAEDNRMVSLELWEASGNYYRYSEMDMNEKSPKTTQIRYINVPVGEYVLVAVLYKKGDKLFIAGTDSKQVRVIK